MVPPFPVIISDRHLVDMAYLDPASGRTVSAHPDKHRRERIPRKLAALMPYLKGTFLEHGREEGYVSTAIAYAGNMTHAERTADEQGRDAPWLYGPKRMEEYERRKLKQQRKAKPEAGKSVA